MAATPALIPVEEYLTSSFSPDAEFIDGRIEEREMGENDHSAWQAAICYWFKQQAVQAGIRVRPELRVQVAVEQFLVPDVALLDRSRLPEPIATHPPIAVFEVLSPGDRLKKLMKKGMLYEAMGIRTIVLVDTDGTAFRFLDGNLGPLVERRFVLDGSKAVFDLDEIAKLVD